jgi:short-subunit dehydrogenase
MSQPRPVALVTGPTTGIGRAFAKELAGRGYDLVLVARSEDALAEVAAEVGALGAAAEVLPAGFGLKKGLVDNDVEDEQRMLDVLVTAVLRLSHAATTAMLERGHGGVINVSSVAGFLPRGTYSAAKAYVTQLSRWADATYRDRGVRTMALCPGFTRTEFHERMEVAPDSAPSWLWLDADRLVRAALDDFDKGKAVSVPDVRYKAVVAVSRYVPTGVLSRFQSLGRK